MFQHSAGYTVVTSSTVRFYFLSPTITNHESKEETKENGKGNDLQISQVRFVKGCESKPVSCDGFGLP